MAAEYTSPAREASALVMEAIGTGRATCSTVGRNTAQVGVYRRQKDDPVAAVLADEVAAAARERGWQVQQSDTILTLTIPEAPARMDLPGLVRHLQLHRQATLRALRANVSGGSDYWRWQGHAELARQLLELLDAEVPQ